MLDKYSIIGLTYRSPNSLETSPKYSNLNRSDNLEKKVIPVC